MDQYEYIKTLGSGNFGVTVLMRHKDTGETVAVKQLPRGSKIDKNVFREVLNHHRLSHPNVIGFKEVYVDDRNLNIVMEYAAGWFHALEHGLCGEHRCVCECDQ
jgi:serine/threonine-protein kinase SRK2